MPKHAGGPRSPTGHKAVLGVPRKSSARTSLYGYEYDALNRRIQETNGFTKNRYIYDQWPLLEERHSGAPSEKAVRDRLGLSVLTRSPAGNESDAEP